MDSGAASFLVVQDDLLHPVLGGNKCRKLDALMPSLAQEGVTHVVRWVLLPPTGCLQGRAQLALGNDQRALRSVPLKSSCPQMAGQG